MIDFKKKKKGEFLNKAINSLFQFSKGKNNSRLSPRNIHDYVSKYHYSQTAES
jgi:hypothetical protein